MILSVLWLTLAANAQEKPQVSLYEAVAVAQWYCRFIAGASKHQFAEAANDERGWSRVYGGANLYRVGFRLPGQTPQLMVLVDATSGDIVHAADSDFPGASGGDTSKERGANLLAKFGRSHEFRYVEGVRHFAGVVDGKRIFNLNGSSTAHLRFVGTHPTLIIVPGKLPPPPTGKPPLSEVEAIKLVKDSDDLRPGLSRSGKAYEAELGFFYDEADKRTHWVWEVRTYRLVNNVRTFSTREYVVDGASDFKLQQKVANSSFRYQSRPARVGLKHVSNLTPQIPKMAEATKLLAKMGRSGLQVRSIVVDQGIRLGFGGNDELVLGPQGQLLSFRSQLGKEQFPDGQTLELGKRFILSQLSKLPEGRFELSASTYGNHRGVVYRQVALGIPFAREMASVGIGEGGKIAAFSREIPRLAPKGLPAVVLKPSQIEAAARSLAVPRLPKSTAGVRYYVTVDVGDLKWAVAGGVVKLCYEVRIMLGSESSRGRKGSGGTYLFDAATGQSLSNYP